MSIVYRGIYCKNCGEVVVSLSRHDFRECSCGDVAIDGGRDYVKKTFKPDAEYQMVKVRTSWAMPQGEKKKKHFSKEGYDGHEDVEG